MSTARLSIEQMSPYFWWGFALIAIKYNLDREGELRLTIHHIHLRVLNHIKNLSERGTKP
ncbi:MAG: hypothetical protein WAK31_03930 [Chthoniobacterales bacterium]